MADEQQVAGGWGDDMQTVVTDLSGAETDTAMTRSEERLLVTTNRRATEVVRVSKRIVTEQRTITVPVRREELVVERFPVTGDPSTGAVVPPMVGQAPPEDQVMVLSTEEPVVTMRTVPLERVHIRVERITEQRVVDEVLRKEQIEVTRVAEPDMAQTFEPTTDRPPGVATA